MPDHYPPEFIKGPITKDLSSTSPYKRLLILNMYCVQLRKLILCLQYDVYKQIIQIHIFFKCQMCECYIIILKILADKKDK